MIEKISNVDSKREYTRIIKSCRDIRINIGYANFYERMTALNILDFLITQTLNVSLMF